MKLLQKKGFTLIELLVVITIIGILATGGVAIYTSQIQKARDTTRINDIEALKSGIEQFYQDKSVYPNTTSTDPNYLTGITTYVPKIPKDPKSGQLCNKGTLNTTGCDYIYAVADDVNGIKYGEYKISTAFENSGNVTWKAANDGWAPAEANRYEVGLNLAASNKATGCDRSATVSVTSWAQVSSAAAGCAAPTIPTPETYSTNPGYLPVVIAGN